MKMKIFRENLVTEELNKFFKNATKSLQINQNPYIIDKKVTLQVPL